jgi:molecular chaperone DnaK (HSP70)
MTNSRLGVLLLASALLVLLFGLQQTQGAVIGIDLSSEFIKVSCVRPGTSFYIVVDEQSKRKIPQAVAFDDGERFFGNGATGFVSD